MRATNTNSNEANDSSEPQIITVTPERLSGAQRVYMTAHSSCAMCDTKLEIRHEINEIEFKIKEEAQCPSCGIRVRSAHHVLH
jgi:hypothetical protein